MLGPEVTAYIAGKGYGAVGTNIFYNIIPSSPDAIIWVIEYGGLMDEIDMGTGNIRLEYPRFQVGTRGVRDDSDGPRLIAQQIRADLVKIGNTLLSGVSYKSVIPFSPPSFLRRDDNFRVYFSFNCQCMKSPSVI